jgi:hypothetical protein
MEEREVVVEEEERRRGRGMPAMLTGEDGRDLGEEGTGMKSGMEERREAVAERPEKRGRKVNDGDAGKEGMEKDVQATRKKTISRSETTVASRERGAYEEEEKKSVSPVAKNKSWETGSRRTLKDLVTATV